MSNSTVLSLANEWRNLIMIYPNKVRETVKKVALTHKLELASFFYEQMLQNHAAKLFLSHEAVQTRLTSSMQNWICQLFSAQCESDFIELVELHQKIGEVHARIDLPMHLVLHGARLLKRKMIELLQECSTSDFSHQMQGSELISESIDISMEVMGQAYASNYDRKSRAEESYRLFSAVQNPSAEKAEQRAAILDWQSQLFFDLLIENPIDNLSSLTKSDYGLWFIHKGVHAFDTLPETTIIADAMKRIDLIIPQLIDLNNQVKWIKEIKTEIRNILINTDILFDKYSEIEAGRDELTRLLNRKYLSVVLSKEVNYARKRGITFALLAVDLDHFKLVNDAYGHAAGDMVLQQLSELLSNRSRAGDYVFRLGGEEFLVLLVDVNKETAVRVAKQINQKIREESFFIPNGDLLKITTSIGVTLFDGHPDYSKSLSRADKALYQAKENGRDQVVYI